MLGQLTAAHGLKARVEGAEALSTANVFRLQTDGISIICLVYMNASTPAHMRYSVRRLRRKFSKGIIMLACCTKEIDDGTLESLRENARADVAAASLAEATRRCIDIARRSELGTGAAAKSSGTSAA
jgi:tryptophan synthase alpha subunit